LKSNFATGNRLQETGNRLPESKNFGNLENFVKTLLKNKIVLCLFFEKSFQYFPCKVFLISSLGTWIHLFLNLEIKLLLILEFVIDLILKSFFGLFVNIFVIIKTSWINLIHHHEACFYTIPHVNILILIKPHSRMSRRT